MKSILILGHNGMLGQMACAYFRDMGYDVVTTHHRFAEGEDPALGKFMNSCPSQIIINGIGKIRQKTNNKKQLFKINSEFPQFLVERLRPDQLLVHPSTDCVFSGKKRSAYEKDEEADAEDDYGRSKFMGEKRLLKRNNTVVIRCSVIGPDRSPDPAGLLGWFLSNRSGNKVQGYTNHIWNGLTTLEWCRQAEKSFNENDYSERSALVQLGTVEALSKHALLTLLNEVYEKRLIVEPCQHEKERNMVLSSDCEIKSLRDQLVEIFEFEKTRDQGRL